MQSFRDSAGAKRASIGRKEEIESKERGESEQGGDLFVYFCLFL